MTALGDNGSGDWGQRSGRDTRGVPPKDLENGEVKMGKGIEDSEYKKHQTNDGKEDFWSMFFFFFPEKSV